MKDQDKIIRETKLEIQDKERIPNFLYTKAIADKIFSYVEISKRVDLIIFSLNVLALL